MKKILSIIIFTNYVLLNFNAQCTANTGTDIQMSCDSYLWIDGNTYTASGTYNLIGTNGNGCYHEDILNLIINQSTIFTK